jgi:hypothetical protein
MKIEHDICLKKCTISPLKIHSILQYMLNSTHANTTSDWPSQGGHCPINHFFLKNKYGDNIKNLGARVASCLHKGERNGVQIPTWHILMLPITSLGVH